MASRNSCSRGALYCRKEKSLGVLCTNFLRLYNRDGVDSVGLDIAAVQLGVERRRIYDIVNILESVGVLKRKAKNQYTYKGLAAIPGALKILKEQGNQERFDAHGKDVPCTSESGLSYKKTDLQCELSESEKVHRREKSLGLLTQNFVKLFLCSSNVDCIISLDHATSDLLGNGLDLTAMRRKARRLYDIANVLSSLELIEKTRDPGTGKPAFRWMGGLEGSCRHGCSTAPNANNSKRVFGTEITNMVSKRCRTNSSIDWRSNVMVNPDKCESSQKLKNVKLETAKQLKNGSKNFVFGPFAPPNLAKMQAGENERQDPSWENISCTYQPNYRNQAVSDLFHHYAEAWKSWYVESADRQFKPGS